jgi:hypothetical protein
MEEKLKMDTSKIYLEPILYNEHVTLLMSFFKISKYNCLIRKNMLFDMSSVHRKLFLNDDPIFNEDMKYKTQIYPKNPIQLGASSSLWFYATMLVLLENKINNPMESDPLYFIIRKVYKLLEIKEQDISKGKIIERMNENIDKNNFLSYKMALKTFIDFDGVINHFMPATIIGPDDYLGKYQKKIYELRNTLNLIELNAKYYSLVFNKDVYQNGYLEYIRDFLENVEKALINIVEAKRENFNYSMKCIKINSSSFIEKHTAVDIAIKEFDDVIEKACSKIKWNISFYTKDQLFKLFFDDTDIFLNIIDK